MSDILLTHGYFLDEDEKEKSIMRPYAPLGLMYLSSWLKSSGVSVSSFDSTFKKRTELNCLLTEDSTKILGIYTNLITRVSVLSIIEQAKICGWTVILGGPESANYIDEYLGANADYIVVGEGEDTLVELIGFLKEGRGEIEEIQGLAYKNEYSEICINPSRELPKDINRYPWPDRELFDVTEYMQAWKRAHNESSISMITARGCPYKCTWCSHAVFGYSHRRRSYLDCADELEHIVNKFNPDLIWYADDVFTINHKWLFNYASELKKRGIKVPFETISRADRMLDERVLDTLQEMGCYRIWIGAESGSQRLLDVMKRQVTVDQVKFATTAAQKRGIKVGMFLMWGFEDENLTDIDETVKSVASIKPDIYLTTVAYPIKGTEYYNKNQSNIIASTDWAKETDRDLRLNSKKSERYYRYANKYLKNFVQSNQHLNIDTIQHSLQIKHAKRYRKLLAAAENE